MWILKNNLQLFFLKNTRIKTFYLEYIKKKNYHPKKFIKPCINHL